MQCMYEVLEKQYFIAEKTKLHDTDGISSLNGYRYSVVSKLDQLTDLKKNVLQTQSWAIKKSVPHLLVIYGYELYVACTLFILNYFAELWPMLLVEYDMACCSLRFQQ